MTRKQTKNTERETQMVSNNQKFTPDGDGAYDTCTPGEHHWCERGTVGGKPARAYWAFDCDPDESRDFGPPDCVEMDESVIG